MDLHPNWSYTIWTDDLVRKEFSQLIDLLIAASVPSVISDILRVNIIARFGGIYMDTDILCLRSFEPLLMQQYCTAFVGSQESNQDNDISRILNGALIGAIPEHNVFKHAAELVLNVALGPESPVIKTGPQFLTKMVEGYNKSTDCIYVYKKNCFITANTGNGRSAPQDSMNTGKILTSTLCIFGMLLGCKINNLSVQ